MPGNLRWRHASHHPAVPGGRNINGWQKAALKLDTQIFSPLLASLRTREIDEVSLTLARDRNSVMVTIPAQSLRGISGWWNQLTKRPRPFLESARG